MADQRRSLLEAVAPAPAAPAPGELAREMEFLQSGASSAGARAVRSAATTASGATLNTRVHPDIATALKRASYKRKLDGVEPNSIRDILEEAVMPWLQLHGYLP